MIEPTLVGQFATPVVTIDTLRHLFNRQNTYLERIETLRRLLVFISTETTGDTNLWDIKKKQEKQLNKLLQKVDDLLVEVKKDND